MKVFALGFLVFLAFAFSSRWYFVCEIRQHCGEEPVVTRTASLQLVDDGKVVLDGYEQFAFQQNSFDPELSDNNRAFLA